MKEQDIEDLEEIRCEIAKLVKGFRFALAERLDDVILGVILEIQEGWHDDE